MGQYDYRLKSMADHALLAGLSRIVGRRNQVTAEFLAYLAELDQRQLFLDLGFSSLFEYCVEALGLCESTAGRHIAAARVCRNHPQVFEMVASGALHASALSLLRKHLTAENAGELFKLCMRKSARKVEELLAARFPRPDVRDLVRRLPGQVRPTLDVGCASKKKSVEAWREPVLEIPNPRESRPSEPVLDLPNLPESRPSEPVLELPNPRESRPSEPVLELSTPRESRRSEPVLPSAFARGQKTARIEPLSAERYGVHFTADCEFRELLERVRGLAGHRLPSGDLLTLLKRGLEAYERELSKERFAVGRKPNRSRGVAPAPSEAELSAPHPPKPELSAPHPPSLDIQS